MTVTPQTSGEIALGKMTFDQVIHKALDRFHERISFVEVDPRNRETVRDTEYTHRINVEWLEDLLSPYTDEDEKKLLKAEDDDKEKTIYERNRAKFRILMLRLRYCNCLFSAIEIPVM